jgi:hypothetical protein
VQLERVDKLTKKPLKMPSSGLWRSEDLVRTGVSEKRIASIILVKGISEKGTTLAVTRNSRTLRRNTN